MTEAFVRLWARIIAVVAMMLPAASVGAQQQDEQVWLQANTNVPIASRWRVTLEQIARFGDRPGGLYQTEIGALFGYRIASNVELGGGYRYVGHHNGNTAADENRFRQQVVASSGRWAGRFRVDERFHPDGDEIGFRIRPLVRYNLPLDVTRKLFLFVSHESFYLPNKTAWGQRRGYERMRNLVGLTFPVARDATLDLGYLNQFRPPRRGSRAQRDHAVSAQITINLKDMPFFSGHD